MSAGLELRINLGSGFRPMEGFLNVDNRPEMPGVDEVVDLNGPWPWGESSVDLLYGEDIVEHLYPLGKAEGQANIIEVMRRCWTVLKPNGILMLRVPSTEGRGAWQDPTHVTYWNINTFRYFTKGFPHHNLYKGWGIAFFLDEDGFIKRTPTDDTGVSWVDAKLKAAKP